MSGRVLKNGRIVILLRGRFAGRKAVIVRLYDGGRGDRKFTHALVAGISKNPRKITRAMEKEDAKKGVKHGKVTHRSVVKPFVKHLNVNHFMPTRYVLDVASDLKSTLDDPTLLDAEKLTKAKKAVRAKFEDRYRKLATAGDTDRAKVGAAYFFRKLRF